MFPWNRSFWVVGILCVAFLGSTGCGKKRVHVATTSGTPGLEESLDAGSGESTDLSDQSGLENANLAESGLGMETESEASLPEESGDLNEGQGESSAEEFASMIPPPQEIQTNPSSEATTPFLGESDSNAQSESADLPLLDDGSQDAEVAVERIPENIAVAKAEPSEAIQRQLEKIREEEVATIAAGLQDVFFEFDSWTITAEGKQALEHDADWLKDQSSSVLLIEGHCDERGTQAYNLVLGKKRAVAIRDYLVELGVESSRLGFISYGKDKPFCTDPTEVCYQLNRRGRLVVQNP